jgi:hypothetical protein
VTCRKRRLLVEGIRLDQHTLKVELPEQLLEHGTLVVLSCCVAVLSDRHTQGRRKQRHLSDERITAATGALDRTSQGLAVTDQLIEIACPTGDLSDGPISDGGANGSDVSCRKK